MLSLALVSRISKVTLQFVPATSNHLPTSSELPALCAFTFCIAVPPNPATTAISATIALRLPSVIGVSSTSVLLNSPRRCRYRAAYVCRSVARHITTKLSRAASAASAGAVGYAAIVRTRLHERDLLPRLDTSPNDLNVMVEALSKLSAPEPRFFDDCPPFSTLLHPATSDDCGQRQPAMLDEREGHFILYGMENSLSASQRHNDQAQPRTSRVAGWPSAGARGYVSSRALRYATLVALVVLYG